jgi:hypothetical protein
MDGLTAPARIPVEVTRQIGEPGRAFRLTDRIGPGRLELGGAVVIGGEPLVDGEPVAVRFALPGETVDVSAQAEVAAGGTILSLTGVLAPDRARLVQYVKERLELP